MIKPTEISEKLTSAKKSVSLSGITLKKSIFIDETGDITDKVIDALPDGTEEVSFKITVELLSEKQGG